MPLTTRALNMASAVFCAAAVVALTIPEPAAACRSTHQSIASLLWTPLMTLPCPEDITSTTSPRRDSQTAPERLNRFVEATLDNLTADVAQGGGEYVASLMALMGIEPREQPRFVEGLQAATLAHSEASLSPDRFLRLARQQRPPEVALK